MRRNSMLTLAVTVIALTIPSLANPMQNNDCTNIKSCSTCILKSSCVWCVTKSKCTKQDCGNDNIIYPKNVPALMSGDSFCPQVVEADVKSVKSGSREGFDVKITQIHLYMAFTTWKCSIVLGGKETITNAMLLGDTVFCEPSLLENKSDSPYIEGRVSVLWDYNKSFDGAVPIRVCRCDLDPQCAACK